MLQALLRKLYVIQIEGVFVFTGVSYSALAGTFALESVQVLEC